MSCAGSAQSDRESSKIQPNQPGTAPAYWETVIKTSRRIVTALLAGLVIGSSGACTAPVDDPSEESSSDTTYGVKVSNGMQLNGITNNGITNNGISNNGISNNGVMLTGVWLEGSQIEAITEHGEVLSSPALEGAQLYATLDDGQSVTIRIDDVTSHTTPYPNDAVYIYNACYRLPSDKKWSLLCGTDASKNPVGAIPLKGRWDYSVGTTTGGSRIDDPDMVTFACKGYALAKCVELGYEPWIGTKKTASLANHHQACTRMLRADYCGDGKSWTVDGTLINVFDGLGIQTDAAPWPTEAEWDADGAICLSHTRIQNMDTVPSCSFAKAPVQCGQKVKWQTTLLVSEAL